VPKSTLIGTPSKAPLSSSVGAAPSSTAYLQGPASTTAESRLQIRPPPADVVVSPETVEVEIPPPERTLPQAIALEALARKAEETRDSSAAPAKGKVAVQERPSEQTRIFSPNLNNPALKPSVPPPAKEEQTRIFSPNLDNPALKPSTAPPPDPQEQTRTYSADTIQRLLSKAEGTEPSVVEDVTRVQRTSSAEELLDDITRAYDVDFQRQLHDREVTSPGHREREVTSPGNRALAESRGRIHTEPRSKWRYLWLSLLVPVVALGVVYRKPVVHEAQQVLAWVNRGIDRTRGVTTPAAPVVADITISIAVSPADATLFLDGVPVSNPLLRQRRPDKALHELVAEAPGHQSLKRSIRLERDLTVMLGLAPLAPASTLEQAIAPATEVAPAALAKAVVVGSPSNTKAKPKSARCDPPFSVDSNGIKTFKPDCL
jgi:hypothetical protein